MRAKRVGRGPNSGPVLNLGGQAVLLLGLGEAAARLGVCKATLRRCDDERVIPRNRRVDELGRRWFPEPFITFLAPFFDEQRRTRGPLFKLRRRVEEAWVNSGRHTTPVLIEEAQ